MAYTRRELYTTNKETQLYLDRLMKDLVVELPPRLAMDIGRHKTIQNIRNLDRKNPYILIGRDDKYHVSIIKLRATVRVKREGNRYIFSL
jgi:hypothetical protein